jgi:hypothetical protein
MSSSMNTRRFSWLGGAAVGALALAAVSVPLTPAQAYIGVDVGPVSIGVPGPYYYGPGPYYGYGPYYHHYYGPGYYGW